MYVYYLLIVNIAEVGSTKNKGVSHSKSRGMLENDKENYQYFTNKRKVTNDRDVKVRSNKLSKNYDSNFTDMEKLNALEHKLNDHDLEDALKSDSGSEILSYKPDELDNIQTDGDGQFCSHSENQSPNQADYSVI
jgi:hypothetical protein